MSVTTTKPLSPAPRLTLTPEHMAVIGEGARSISPSWAATFISDPNCPADSANIGAASGGCPLFDVFDTYAVYPVEDGRFQLADMRDDFATLGAFRTVHETVEAMKAHAASVRY